MRYRILIADDSTYMRESMREILEEAGHDIIGEAVNGLNAVEIYKALVPDIVMMDAAMPEGSGLDAMQKIMEINKDAIVIILTVVGKPDIVVSALGCGARSYLTKPFDKASVLQALKMATADLPQQTDGATEPLT